MTMEKVATVLIFLMLLCKETILESVQARTATHSPALFIFGDSLSDVGNNNFILLSTYKANFFPNGIDYPQRILPTGRFCNGRLVIDILATYLKFPVPGAYLSPRTRGSALLKGVNYASAGCGILDETSNNSSGCLSLSTQLRLHKNTLQRLVAQIGAHEAEDFLKKSLYFIAMGSNDFLGNFILNDVGNSLNAPAEFIDRLTSALANDVKILYNHNARHMVIIGLGPLGCIPSQRARDKGCNCNEELNSWAQSTNQAFQKLVHVLSAQFPDALITFANPFNIARDFIQNPSNYGFKVTKKACCGGGRLNAQIPCLPISKICSNRSEHMFWDAWHPTEAVNKFVVNGLLSLNSTSVAPWSIQEVAFGVQ